MSILLVPTVEVKVPMNEARSSTTTIGTDYLGPCLAFLLDFKHYGNDTSVLIHYSFSIKDERTHLFGELIKILQHIVTEVKRLPEIDPIISNDQASLSNIQLFVAGGDSMNSKIIHSVLCLLNRKLDFRIETFICDADICFMYYELLNHVTIVKCVSKMLDSEDDDQSDEDDNDHRKKKRSFEERYHFFFFHEE